MLSSSIPSTGAGAAPTTVPTAAATAAGAAPTAVGAPAALSASELAIAEERQRGAGRPTNDPAQRAAALWVEFNQATGHGPFFGPYSDTKRNLIARWIPKVTKKAEQIKDLLECTFGIGIYARR